jgi:hypothetical protein
MDPTQLQQGAQQGGSAAAGMAGRGAPPGGIAAMGGRGGILPGGPTTTIVLVAIFAVTLIVMAIAFYKLYQKAGFSGAIGLLAVVPVINLGVALYLAFAEWPVVAELAQVKLVAASGGQPTAAASPTTATASEGAEPAIPLTT